MHPEGFFARQDETDDARFYVQPRFVLHIDDATVAALTDVYREVLPAGGAVLDLMSSWVSHLPAEVRFGRVSGLGMNEAELAANQRLDDHVVHDLNRDPELPFPDSTFDAVVNAVSVQYLTRPVEVFRSCARVLRPGAVHVVAMSHRCFPTKAIRAWHLLPASDRLDAVASYFRHAGGYGEPQRLDRSPPAGDPLWVVMAHRLE